MNRFGKQTRERRISLLFVLAITGYFLLHLIIRINLSDSLELDEAEAVFYSQQLRLGYGSQPPLYAWLQWAMFSIFGLKLFSLSLLKNLLLAATYLGIFFMARPMVGVYCAMAASVSLILFPQIGWESQRDLTHSVLLTALASLTLWSYFATLHQPTVQRYAIFGMLIGLGLQSKYSFVIFVAGLICASLLVQQHRQVLWNRKAGVTAAVTVLVLLPHLLWLMNNLEAASSGTLRKMAEGARDAGYLRNVAAGIGSLSKAALAFALPVIIVYGLAYRRYRKVFTIRLHNPNTRFFIVLYGSFLALLILTILTGEVVKFKDRWMQPLLFSLPLAFFVMLPTLPAKAMFRKIAPIAGVVAAAVLILIPLRVHVGPALGMYLRAHHPYPELTAELSRRFPRGLTVLAEDSLIAGNLHFQKPALHTLRLNDVLKLKTPLNGDILLVMPGNAEPGWQERFRAAYPQSEIVEHGRLNLNYRFGGNKTISYDYAHVAIKGS